MAQPCGTTDHPRIDVEARDELSGEDTSLLGVPKAGEERIERGGRAALVSIGNFTNTIVGSGVLSLPLALPSTGIVPGTLTCMFSLANAAFGLYLLSRAAAKIPHR